jgi:preprotein translocase SecE subunit
VELAEAQLAVGRPEPDEEPITEEELEAEEEREAAADFEAQEDFADREELEAEAQLGEEVGPARHGAVERRTRTHGRLIGFLQGSWRELQRVQWPDRRQVVQATGVVIGFVIVAGLYLAAADGLASKLMDFILK